MHHLFGKKIIFAFSFLFLFSFGAIGQVGGVGNYNYKDFQKKAYYFGLNIGPNTTGYRINNANFFINNEQIKVAEGQSGFGLNLNMIANLKLGDYVDFRFSPGFSFTDRSINYTTFLPNENGSTTTEVGSEAVFFELPFHVRYKSEPYKDKRVFVTGGIKYSYDVASNKDTERIEVRFSPHDFQWEVGIGMQFFYPYFIFSPEIRFSRGITNVLIYDNNLVQSRVLEGIFSQVFTISFNFEG